MRRRNYRFASDGNQSDYEKDGIHYRSQGTLGSGVYASARLFKPLGRRKKKKQPPPVVVLRPQGAYQEDSVSEAAAKYKFFETLYGSDHVYLTVQDKTYRLVVPYVEGTSLGAIDNITSHSEQLLHALGFIRMLSWVHLKEYVIIDFNKNNFIFRWNKNNQITYHPIDGGLSRLVNDSLPSLFAIDDEECIKEKRNRYGKIAPECWDKTLKKAEFSMDVYGFGMLLKERFVNPELNLLALLNRCTDLEPQKRPKVYEIINELNEMLQPSPAPKMC